MWLKLGTEELINLEHCSSLKKGEKFTLELRYPNPKRNRIIHFDDENGRDIAFDKVVKNLVRIQKAME